MAKNNMETYTFKSSTGAMLTPEDVVREVVTFMEADPARTYKVIIGTDSEQLRDTMADFVTAIVVHRVGNGGRYFWRRVDGKTFHTLRDRIIHEVVLSLEVAQIFLKKLRRVESPADWSFEIHADIGMNGPTSELIQEVVGMIRAYNFKALVKPESYVASKVADRHI